MYQHQGSPTCFLINEERLASDCDRIEFKYLRSSLFAKSQECHVVLQRRLCPHFALPAPVLRFFFLANHTHLRDLNTLFRSHTLASKMLHELLQIYGRSYLLTTLKPVVDKVSRNSISCTLLEVAFLNQFCFADLQRERALLCYFSLVFTCITESTSRCPSSLKAVLSDLRMVVREKTGRPDVELLALSSFLIMRFFAAAVLSPKTFGIKHEQPVRSKFTTENEAC
uniref:Ras-GAP domain-containing protein n=1 Tax=Angiostrongylus cantonensis TaxID=6313 RepID=A0A0K0D609_ANGCA